VKVTGLIDSFVHPDSFVSHCVSRVEIAVGYDLKGSRIWDEALSTPYLVIIHTIEFHIIPIL
jgi:hypothetical protein